MAIAHNSAPCPDGKTHQSTHHGLARGKCIPLLASGQCDPGLAKRPRGKKNTSPSVIRQYYQKESLKYDEGHSN